MTLKRRRSSNSDSDPVSDLDSREELLSKRPRCARFANPHSHKTSICSFFDCPWETLGAERKTQLREHYQDIFNRVWDGDEAAFQWDTWANLFGALGLIAVDMDQLRDLIVGRHEELYSIINRAHRTHNFYDLCRHRLFFNEINAEIDGALLDLGPFFHTIRNGALPSYQIDRDTWRTACPFDLVSDGCPSQPLMNCIKTMAFEQVHLIRKWYPSPQTPSLLKSLAQNWGLYFAFSPNKTAEESREFHLSQDLVLAMQQLSRAADMAHFDATPEAMQTAAQCCFYALYLTRIIVLSSFLDSLPRGMSAEEARQQWAVFQYNPPSKKDGNDIFATVYRAVADGSLHDIRRSVDARFSALCARNKHFFPQDQGKVLPFEIVVNETENFVVQPPASGRQPACSRFGVQTLFWGVDSLS